jgi:hypothetical protein
MTKPVVAGALLISVWTHEGRRIGRFRTFRRIDGPQEDLGVVVGDEAIIAVVRAWLAGSDAPVNDRPT